jgi:hypothetical protein
MLGKNTTNIFLKRNFFSTGKLKRIRQEMCAKNNLLTAFDH